MGFHIRVIRRVKPSEKFLVQRRRWYGWDTLHRTFDRDYALMMAKDIAENLRTPKPRDEVIFATGSESNTRRLF